MEEREKKEGEKEGGSEEGREGQHSRDGGKGSWQCTLLFLMLGFEHNHQTGLEVQLPSKEAVTYVFNVQSPVVT